MFGLPKRWEMAILLQRCTALLQRFHYPLAFMFTFYLHNSGICVVYTLRVNMSVAAVKMKDDLDWSEEEKGLVLVCFNIPLPFRKI
jgi:hypothetical protein